MSIRVLLAYQEKVISEDLSSMFRKDRDIELVGVMNCHQLNEEIFEKLNPHVVMVGHMSSRYDLASLPSWNSDVDGQRKLFNDGYARTDLGGREAQVLKLVAVGRTSKEIARHLAISPSTVDVHRRNIMRKLGLHKAADLTRFAIRHHMISI
jgi:DNA-binding CsgD family transcriptional regulator